MSSSVFFNFFGWPDSPFPLSGSYKAQSPTFFKQIEYDHDEIWAEVARIDERAIKENSPYTIGRNLYIMIPGFANPLFFYNRENIELISEYYMMKEFNIPLARDLDSANALRLNAYLIIQRELMSCYKLKGEI